MNRIISDVAPLSDASPRSAQSSSRVDWHEDEHGEFYVFRCPDGAYGREWADPDEAELERLAHDAAAHRVDGAW